MKKKNYIGQKFGRLLVLSEIKSKSKQRRVLCKCDCGATKEVQVCHLVSGHTTSCGCLRKELIVDNTKYIGKKYGRLTILSEPEGEHRYVNCKCDCGTIKQIQLHALKSGRIVSCGCYNKEVNKERLTTHGMHNTKGAYFSWQSMKARCLNPNATGYAYYGGRGIKVCERWLKFENFYADMGDPPSGMTIDRIDNNGNYEPSNCKWSTLIEQSNNKRSNHRITFNGLTKTLKQWANTMGINYGTLCGRINVYNWPVERALTQPVRGRP